MLVHWRPLGEVALVRDPALVIGADSVVDISAPGHVGEDLKQVFQLLWGQGTVPVLQPDKHMQTSVRALHIKMEIYRKKWFKASG